jgi:hypothetical protein
MVAGCGKVDSRKNLVTFCAPDIFHGAIRQASRDTGESGKTVNLIGLDSLHRLQRRRNR